MTAIPLSTLATSGCWQSDFVSVLPQIRTHAAIRFRGLPSVEREEAIAEATAAAFQNYADLVRQRKLDQAYPSSLASFAVRHVLQDRHVGGRQNSKDILSALAQRRRGFAIQSLSAPSRADDAWRVAVWEDRRVSPADQAAFNLDFEAWLRKRARRERRIINALAAGDAACDVAARFGLSAARVSQLRREFGRSWERFQNGEAERQRCA